MNIRIYSLAALSVAALGLASCSEEQGNAPDAGEKVVLKASLNQSASRFQSGDKVAVAASGRNFTYTLAEDGSMTPDGSGLTWGGSDFEIKAWTPYVTAPVALADQSSAAKMAACDLLAADAKVTSRYAYLIFNHQMTRVSWTLAHVDDSYTADQVASAKVSLIGYGSVNFSNGAVTPVGAPTAEIASFETAGDNGRAGEAILAPADMWDKPLIKVQIAGDEYIYSPSRSEGATSVSGSLEAGTWKKYSISITRKTLSVSCSQSAVEWTTTTEIGSGDITDAKLEAEIAADVASLPGFKATGIEGGYITDRAAGFSITYTENGFGGLSWTGNCKVTRTETAAAGSASTQTYTFTDVKSDIAVTYLAGVEAGDYVYDNSAWGKEESREGCRTIGRVFRVGLDSADDSQYSLCKVRGYVVPLRFPDNGEMQWFASQADETFIKALADIPVIADPAAREKYYGGCRLTSLLNTALAPYSATWAAQAPFWNAYKTLDLDAPALSSGWYIPSYAQLKDVCASGMYDKFSGVYWSSQVYPGTGDVATGGIGEGPKNTLWAIRCGADQAVGYGWVIDRAKLLTVLTF